MNFDKIPLEMRVYRAWVVWKYEKVASSDGTSKQTKVPYNPINGKHANVNDPWTWATFDDAVKAAPWFSGIGFVFSHQDPYAGIDLDQPKETDSEPKEIIFRRQMEIFDTMNSYSEKSPSGKGLHIIVRGNVPSGRRRSCIEVYSSGRFLTMTGDVYRDMQIAPRQDELMQLWASMKEINGVASAHDGLAPQREEDEVILQRASAAFNGDKFDVLAKGEWQQMYSSQSEADFAFIDIIAFYTQNAAQIKRIFRNSLLGSRRKALRDDYVDAMIRRSFDQMPPPVDISHITKQLELQLTEQKTELARQAMCRATPDAPVSEQDRTDQENLPGIEPEVNPEAKPLHLRENAPGLLGEIATYIYKASPRPTPEAALAGAIGLLAGIVGRAYNVSGTGLNQYVLLLAPSGAGKEAMATGIGKLMKMVRVSVPASGEFIGPAEIASGQALIKYLNNKSACFVSILGEFGHTLKQISMFNANSSQIMLRKILLQLFNLSGHEQVMNPSIYSDKEKNTHPIASPAVTILGESVPSRFYENIDDTMIAEGLLPRFLIIEYRGRRQPLNKDHAGVHPPFTLVEQLAQLCANCLMVMQGQRVINVKITPDAEKLADEFDRFCDRQINETERDAFQQLWNRGHIKVLKLAGLLAVGRNMYEPMIIANDIEWAKSIVIQDVWSMIRRFERGEVGNSSDEVRQLNAMIGIVKHYVQTTEDISEQYQIPKLMFTDRVIPYAYISRRCMGMQPFKRDRLGATNSIKRSLQVLVERDVIREIGKKDLADRYNSIMRAFYVHDLTRLREIG